MADAVFPLPPRRHDPPEAEFQALYGRWRPLRPAAVARLLRGVDFPWWVGGGWAVDAASGTGRHHDDTDVVVLRRDLPAVRQALAGHHLWQADSGWLRPLHPGEEPAHGVEQLWVRRDADSPWILDVLLTPSDGEDWLYKRDARVRRPVADLGRTVDRVPYLRPEVVLLFKAHHLRGKDQADFAAVLPALEPAARHWLADALSTVEPGHPWLTVLRGDAPAHGGG